MELLDRIRVVKKYAVLLVLSALLGMGAGLALSLLQTPIYSAWTRVFVSVQAGGSTAELALANSYTISRVESYAELVESQRVLDDVIAELELDLDRAELAERISATIVPATTIIEITATSSSAIEAAALADAAAANLSSTVEDIEGRPDLPSPVQLATVEAATVPSSPVSPRTLVNVAVGGLILLALAVAFAFLREVLNTRVQGERDVRGATSAPILGTIALDPKVKRRRLIVHVEPHSPRSESFRTLRTNLQFIEVEKSSRSFVVTSALPGEGKSTTAANLAVALAAAGQTVVLVDADLRRPQIADLMSLEGAVGLTDVLIGRTELNDAVQQWGSGSLYVLPAGQVPPNPSELLGLSSMTAMLEQLRSDFEWVLFDAPPLLPVTDAAVLSKHVDGVLLVASVGTVSRHQLHAAVARLENVDARVSGVVLTMVPTRGADAYAYGRYTPVEAE